MTARGLAPWVGVALCVHGVAFAASDRGVRAASSPEMPLEIDLAVAPPSEPPAPPAPLEAPAHEEAPAVQVRAKAAPPAAPTAPRETAARAGALLTAGEASQDDDPVAFVTDPKGQSYGSGIVARGGTADHGLGRAVAPAVAIAVPGPPGAAGDVVIPAANLSRAPALEEPDACRGLFPSEAMADEGSVDMFVVVQASGRVAKVTVVRESPDRQGFGSAARACLSAKRFAPGVDRAGTFVTSSAAVRVRFTR